MVKKYIDILIIIFSLFLLYKDNTNKIEMNINNISNKKNSINNNENKEVLDKYRNIYNNQDIIGYLKINDDINTLVVQTTNNNYYLNHSIEKKYQKYGQVFLDYRINLNDYKKLIIYGHNSSKDTPFKHLMNYLNEEYYKNNTTIKLYLNNTTIKYKIFSIYITSNNYEHMKLSFNNKTWLNHLNKLQELSIYQNNITFDFNEELIILQTCADTKANKLLIICGRRENEI